MKKKTTTLLAVGLAVILLSSLYFVGTATAAKGGTNLPFKATLTGAARWEFPGETPANCTDVTTFTEATGQATHMGKIEVVGFHCPAEPYNESDGRLTLISANGDELYAIYDYDPMSESNEIPITLNGGTGKFADASGPVILTYDVVPQFKSDCDPETDPFGCMDLSIPWPWSATLIGTISY
jgi:hypothetical protein